MNEYMYSYVSRCVSKNTRKLCTYSVERELRVLVDTSCYGDVAALENNYRLVDKDDLQIILCA